MQQMAQYLGQVVAKEQQAQQAAQAAQAPVEGEAMPEGQDFIGLDCSALYRKS